MYCSLQYVCACFALHSKPLWNKRNSCRLYCIRVVQQESPHTTFSQPQNKFAIGVHMLENYHIWRQFKALQNLESTLMYPSCPLKLHVVGICASFLKKRATWTTYQVLANNWYIFSSTHVHCTTHHQSGRRVRKRNERVEGEREIDCTMYTHWIKIGSTKIQIHLLCGVVISHELLCVIYFECLFRVLFIVYCHSSSSSSSCVSTFYSHRGRTERWWCVERWSKSNTKNGQA